MTNYDLPNEYVNQARGALQEGVQLPFPVAYVYWMNGKPAYAEQKDARYFGGWASSQDSLEPIMIETGLDMPDGFHMVAMASSSSGNEYSSYISRVVRVIPIAKRKRWPEGRSHVQILSYLADFDQKEKIYSPWNAVVLSAKGLSSDALEKAFAEWGRLTGEARQKYANGLPEHFFYAPLGTFTEQPVRKEVGKKPNINYITPCQLPPFDPGKITKENLDRWYVGREIADKIWGQGGLLHQAQEWLHAWDDASDDGITPETFKSRPQGAPVSESPEYMDDIPF